MVQVNFFPGSLPRGLTPITRKDMEGETGGYSRKCAQLLEHERECEKRESVCERDREGGRKREGVGE